MAEEEEEKSLLLTHSTGNGQEQQLLQSNRAASLMKETWLESCKIWQIAVPSIFTRLAMFSMTIVTQAFAGHLGDLNLAAISIATTVIISISFGFLLGMASALETFCGQAYGAKQYHLLGIYLQRSWIVLSLCSMLLLPMFLFATPILKLIGQPTEVAEQTGLFTLQRFLQSQLKTGIIALISGVALAIHALVSWVFVYKLRVGIVGTALTLDFSWWVSIFGMFGYCLCGGCPLTWSGFSSQAFVGLWEFFKISLASGIMLLLENFYFRVLIIVSGYMHKTEVAVDALSIWLSTILAIISIYAWESMITLGLLAAAGVRVSNQLGANNAKGAKFSAAISVLTSLVLGLCFWSIIIAFPENLATIFTSNSSVIAMVNELAVILSLTVLLNCIQPVLSGVAVGSGWQALVAVVNIGSYYIVGLPLGIFLGWLLHLGIKGIWAGMLMGTVVQTFILTIITIGCEWEKEAEKAHIYLANEASSFLWHFPFYN
ncbi:hypothetical protein K2173_007920 [Erythroxylum novogranatense]|uniref:Protein DETOXIFICATION n=1 Tax=Erythroxylum novogranatense TaxID=1862640 RepID=A0AAV8T7W0_9ROSI|nr:hypothetical protein K2173_007920 [Erythroxylum novogranatense]